MMIMTIWWLKATRLLEFSRSRPQAEPDLRLFCDEDKEDEEDRGIGYSSSWIKGSSAKNSGVKMNIEDKWQVGNECQMLLSFVYVLPSLYFDASKRCVWQNIVPIWKVVARNFAIRRILPEPEFWHQENFASRRLGCCLWCEGWKISTNPSVAITSAAQQTNQLVNEDGFVGIVQQNIFSLSFVPQKYVGSILKLSQKWSKIDGGSQQGISKKHQSSGTIASTWLHRLVSKIRN